MSTLSNREEKQHLKRNIIITSAVVFALSALIALIYNISMLVSANVRNARLEAELDSIQRILDENENQIELRNSPEFIEDFARRYLEMRRADESVFIARPRWYT